MICQNEQNINYTFDTSIIKEENWIDTDNGIEVDTNRLNGICINDYTMVIDTLNFEELVKNSTILSNNNIDITATQLYSFVDIQKNNHNNLNDTCENNIILNEGNKCPILMNNMQSDITSEIIENPVLLESNIDSTFKNSLHDDEQVNELNVSSKNRQRQVKYQSQKNKLASKEYIGFKMINGKMFQNVSKEKKNNKGKM